MVKSSKSNAECPVIASFTGRNQFLSNFFPVDILHQGIEWPTLEHAYQASKTLHPGEKSQILIADTPGIAKYLGRHKVTLRADWEEIKEEVMLVLLRKKFDPLAHPELAFRLQRTGMAMLVEGNAWGDRYWGVCKGEGKNRLGHLLMEVRRELNAR